MNAFARMHDVLYRRHGQSASYADADGSMRPAHVIVDRSLSQFGETAAVAGGSALISVRTAEVVERPRRGDTFSLTEGPVFYVDSVVSSDGYEHRCMAHER